MQNGLLPREEAEAWLLEQAQVRPLQGLKPALAAGAACTDHGIRAGLGCATHQPEPESPDICASHFTTTSPQKKGGGKSPSKPAAKRPSKAAEPKRKRAAADDRWVDAGFVVSECKAGNR